MLSSHRFSRYLSTCVSTDTREDLIVRTIACYTRNFYFPNVFIFQSSNWGELWIFLDDSSVLHAHARKTYVVKFEEKIIDSDRIWCAFIDVFQVWIKNASIKLESLVKMNGEKFACALPLLLILIYTPLYLKCKNASFEEILPTSGSQTNYIFVKISPDTGCKSSLG